MAAMSWDQDRLSQSAISACESLEWPTQGAWSGRSGAGGRWCGAAAARISAR